MEEPGVKECQEKVLRAGVEMEMGALGGGRGPGVGGGGAVLRQVGSEAGVGGGPGWQSGAGPHTHLVTSGPPILSGSSETLGERRGQSV